MPVRRIQVSITFLNNGTMPWTFQDHTTFGYQGDAAKFGVTGPNQTIPIGTVIRPGQSETYSFTMTAPAENGTYNPWFQMVWEGHQMFGQVDNKTILVVNGTGPAATACAIDSGHDCAGKQRCSNACPEPVSGNDGTDSGGILQGRITLSLVNGATVTGHWRGHGQRVSAQIEGKEIIPLFLFFINSYFYFIMAGLSRESRDMHGLRIQIYPL